MGAITYWKGFGISKIESSKVLAEEDIEGMQITLQKCTAYIHRAWF